MGHCARCVWTFHVHWLGFRACTCNFGCWFCLLELARANLNSSVSGFCVFVSEYQSSIFIYIFSLSFRFFFATMLDFVVKMIGLRKDNLLDTRHGVKSVLETVLGPLLLSVETLVLRL
eukprot:sb/3476396/